MNQTKKEDAIRKAKRKLGFEDSTPAKAWTIRRLDHPSETYYLVQLGDPNAPNAVAIVDPDTGEVGVYARLSGGGSHIRVDSQTAIKLVAGKENAKAELVWMPCTASESPLYPFWEVRTPSGVRYVNQQGRIHDKLDRPAPGA
jgi:hypothetical protein